jgi:hypothetical protein
VKRQGALFILPVLVTGLLRAEDGASWLTQGDAAYAKRDDLVQARSALTAYERAAAAGGAAGIEAQWKAARTAWWLGEHGANRAERLALYQQGMDLAKRALAGRADTVEAHFWLGANLGSLGDTKGVMKSLSLVQPIRHEMQEVIRINDHYLDGGAYRVLGVVDYKVPGLLGGSKKRAKEELDKALAMGPRDPFTHYYLAEYYRFTGDKAASRAELDRLNTLAVAPQDEPEWKMLKQRAARELR